MYQYTAEIINNFNLEAKRNAKQRNIINAKQKKPH